MNEWCQIYPNIWIQTVPVSALDVELQVDRKQTGRLTAFIRGYCQLQNYEQTKRSFCTFWFSKMSCKTVSNLQKKLYWQAVWQENTHEKPKQIDLKTSSLFTYLKPICLKIRHITQPYNTFSMILEEVW